MNRLRTIFNTARQIALPVAILTGVVAAQAAVIIARDIYAPSSLTLNLPTVKAP